MRPHKVSVRTQSFITSNKVSLFQLKARKIMTKKLNSKQGQMYKQSESDELFAFAKTEQGIIILVGKYKVSTKTFKTYEEAEAYLQSKPYEILINVTMLMHKLQENEKATEKAKVEDKKDK